MAGLGMGGIRLGFPTSISLLLSQSVGAPVISSFTNLGTMCSFLHLQDRPSHKLVVDSEA